MSYTLSRKQKKRKETLKYSKSRQLKNDIKSSGCSLCGYDKCLSALEFHHVREKTNEINKLNTQKRILEESENCIVVCANCHREIHAGLIKEIQIPQAKQKQESLF